MADITYMGYDNGLEEMPNMLKAWPKISKMKTPAAAAKALHRAIVKDAVLHGHNPDIETGCWSPTESARRGYGKTWHVSWEAGPYEWGVDLSGNINDNPHWFLEPYHSFDVGFSEA